MLLFFTTGCRCEAGAAVVFPSHCGMGDCNVEMPRSTLDVNGLEVCPTKRQLCVTGLAVLAMLANPWEGTLPVSHHTPLSCLFAKLISGYIVPSCAMPPMMRKRQVSGRLLKRGS